MRPPQSWQCPEISPIGFTSSPSPGLAHSSQLLELGSTAKLSKDKLMSTFSHKAHPTGSRLDSVTCHSPLHPPVKFGARCSNSTPLECCTRPTNQARFMMKEEPSLFPLTRIKRSHEYIQFHAGWSWMLPTLGSILPGEKKPGSESLQQGHLHTTGERQNHRDRQTLESDTGTFFSFPEQASEKVNTHCLAICAI